MENKQERTPLFTALKNYALDDEITSFEFPGHKLGKYETEFKTVVGDMALKMDVNSNRAVDNLGNPKTYILEAEELIADAFGYDQAYMLINGTTVGNIAMIMTVCNHGDKIIMLRNAHKSAINGVILCGAIPIFLEPTIDYEWGISHNISFENIEKTIIENQDAKAILLNNPTYFGVTTDIERVVELAHRFNMAVLLDEAHGSHFNFNENLPKSGAYCKVDMASLSVHKTSGSMTQSSILLVNHGIVRGYDVKTVLNLLQSTSANYLLLSSLDVARKNLALRGKEIFNNLIELCNNAKAKLANIPGLEVLTKQYIQSKGMFDLDPTKVVIKVNGLGLTGFQVYDILMKEYKVQLEIAETYVVMAVVSVGDDEKSINRLVEVFTDLSKRYYGKPKFTFNIPELTKSTLNMIPRDAFFAKSTPVRLDEALGYTSGESIMLYPPGIPLVIPGEVINQDMINLLKFYIEQNTTLLSDYENEYKIKVIK